MVVVGGTDMDKTLIKRLVCLLAGLAVLVCAGLSFNWRAVHDVPIMLYMARLMVEANQVPYRDFFDMNLPGTYWMMAGLVRFFGCSDLAVRTADLMLLGGILCLTFLGLRSWGCEAASLGVCLFALRYFSGTWWFSMQREYLALLPLSAVLALTVRPSPCSARRGTLSGFLFAWLFLIKPQLALFGIPVIWFVCQACPTRILRVRFVLSLCAGFAIPIIGCAVWLVGQGAWRPFVELVTQYWPLYGQMTGQHEVVSGLRRLGGIMRGAGTMLISWYSAVALAGLIVGTRRKVVSRTQLVYWLSLLALAVIIPCLSGQFWGYHKLPFYYLTLCAASLVFAEGEKEDAGQDRFAWAGVVCGTILVAVWIGVAIPRSLQEAVGPGAVTVVKQGVPDKFASFLRGHLKEGDRVQPLDWTGGAVHGMLMAGARPATRFLYTFHFYHHVHAPFIQRIRGEFIHALQADPPRFLLETVEEPRPYGEGTSETFLELEQWRGTHYHVAESGAGYQIWERNGA